MSLSHGCDKSPGESSRGEEGCLPLVGGYCASWWGGCGGRRLLSHCILDRKARESWVCHLLPLFIQRLGPQHMEWSCPSSRWIVRLRDESSTLVKLLWNTLIDILKKVCLLDESKSHQGDKQD